MKKIMAVMLSLLACTVLLAGCNTSSESNEEQSLATPILGAVKLIDALLNLGIPYASYIGISGIENPAIVFILSIVMGVALYLIGRGCWKLLVYYIKGVSKAKQHLSI